MTLSSFCIIFRCLVKVSYQNTLIEQSHTQIEQQALIEQLHTQIEQQVANFLSFWD